MKRVLASLIAIVICLQINIVPAFAAQAPEPKSESAILMHQETGKVLYEKNSHTKVYPASTTKILTALLALENLNLDEIITVGDEVDSIGLDSSSAGLAKGDKISVRTLMWALLLPSGNDASYIIAVNVARKLSGNPEMDTHEAIGYFSDLMNKRSHEIGAKESNFINPDGYHDDNHYSTSYDLALIAREAMKQDLFREIIKTRTYSYKNSATESIAAQKNQKELLWVNRNELISKFGKFYYQYATGIKTGHTSIAGFCLVSSASKGGVDLISVIMKEPVEELRWTDTRDLMEYGFSNFVKHTVLTKDQVIKSIKVGKKHRSETIDLDVLSEKDFTDILNKDDISKITQKIEWNKELVAPLKEGENEIKLLGPIEKGQVVGKVTYTLNDKTLVESNLLAKESVMRKDFIDAIFNVFDWILKFKFIIIAVAALFVILILGRSIASRSSNKRRIRY